MIRLLAVLTVVLHACVICRYRGDSKLVTRRRAREHGDWLCLRAVRVSTTPLLCVDCGERATDPNQVCAQWAPVGPAHRVA